MKKQSSVNTIIFDMDGTLLDTLTDLTISLNYCLDYFGVTTYTDRQVRAMVGNGLYQLMVDSLPKTPDSPSYEECAALFMPHYQKHMYDHTCPYPDILNLLSALKKEGYQMAIVSNKFDAAVKKLNHLFFSDYISVAIGENEAAGIAKKPAPDTVFQAMKELHVSPESCLYIGDSEVDIQTAANANIPCVSVNWGFKDTPFLLEHGASHIISSPMELMDLLHTEFA